MSASFSPSFYVSLLFTLFISFSSPLRPSVIFSCSLFLSFSLLSRSLSLLPLPWLLITRFLQVAVTFRQHKLNQNPPGLSWINKTRGPSINMRIHKELMGSWEWNPIHSYRRLSGVLYACLYLLVVMAVVVCVCLKERPSRKLVSVVSVLCGPTKQLITMLD